VRRQLPVRGLGAQQDLDHAIGHRIELVEQQRRQLRQAGRDLAPERLHSITSAYRVPTPRRTQHNTTP
jgi:hypothetical protein